MRFVPKVSIGVRLFLAFLAVIALSWVLSGASAVLLVRHQMAQMRQAFVAGGGDAARLPQERPITWRDVLIAPEPLQFRDMQPRGPRGHRTDRQRPPRADAQPGEARPPFGEGRPGPPPVGMNAPGAGPPDQPGGPPPEPPGGPAGNRPPNPGERVGLLILFLRLGTSLLIAAVAGIWLSRRITRPLRDLSDGAHAVRQGDFSYRVPVRHRDEFGEVAEAMNAMSAQVAGQIRTLEEDAVRRRQLLADVAHELRSPVTTIRTMAGALNEGVAADPARRAHAAASAVRASDRLMHLVTDLLELARLDLQELPMHPQPVDVRALAAAAVRAQQAAAQAAGLTLREPADGSPIMATADPDRVAQVLDNLIGNAVSHAGSGAAIDVEVMDGSPMRVIVRDTGRGIPAEHLPHVFDAFYRVDKARTPGCAHSGLGLRIARSLAQAMGGDLALKSQEGRGTAVMLTLPREDVSSVAAPSRATPYSTTRGTL